jgi:uncharacterized membrane protein
MTVLIFALLGGVVGGALLDELGGFVLGAVVGALAGWVADLAGRVRLLERRLDAQRAAAARASAAAESREPPPAASAPEPVRSTRAERAPESDAAGAVSVGSAPSPAVDEAAPAPVVARASRPAPAPQQPSRAAELFAAIVRWFTSGNVPVKVGVVLSLFGVGFLVKEGIDREWFVLPLELRLALVALFGIGLLVVGWRLRDRQRVYALSVQGGGVGVLYLTIYASFALYHLLPAALAFALLVVVTAAAGVLAVAQDARSLAVLGVLGGFLAPVLVSTGSGNHVALFGYYALLNSAIVGIAWFKAWRVLNVLGFVFTFGIGALWGYESYTPDKFGTTEPFVVLFTLMYLAIPVLFALRSAPRLRGFVDGTLMFGTPIVAFAIQSRVVEHFEYGLAISAVAIAALYVAMATYLYRRKDENLRVLVEAQLALGVVFVTVAVPLALDARWTSAAWALQGAALVWLAFRQDRKLALAAGCALQVLSGVSYFEQASVPADLPVVNGYFLGALLLALAGLFSGRLLDPRRAAPERDLLPSRVRGALAILALLWGGAWWFYAGLTELDRHLGFDRLFAAVLVFTGATTVTAALAARRVDWPRLGWLGLAAWPIALLALPYALLVFDHPAEDYGAVAWAALIGAMAWYLRLRETDGPAVLHAVLHAFGYWLVAGLLAWEAHWLVASVVRAGGAWPMSAAIAVATAGVAATLVAVTRGPWPFARHPRAYALLGAGVLLAAIVLVTFAFNVDSDGAAQPLPYLPLVNPLELTSVLVVLVLLRWLAAAGKHDARWLFLGRARGPVGAAAAWFLVTMSVARAVHHWDGVGYDAASLMASTTFQGALSMVWGGAGLAAMIAGARSARRSVWLVGAALMAVVVAKLFLVDLGNTGTLARVVSFLGVGVLLLVVGYFAPVPPRAEPAASAASQ